jgi:hypothetical protein
MRRRRIVPSISALSLPEDRGARALRSPLQKRTFDAVATP